MDNQEDKATMLEERGFNYQRWDDLVTIKRPLTPDETDELRAYNDMIESVFVDCN